MTEKPHILDAWALLALLQREEPAATRVKQLLEQAQARHIELFISIINLGEVYYRIAKRKGETSARETLEQVLRLSLTALSATDERVWMAASLKARHAISYTDAFAAAAAAELDAILVTGAPELKALEGEIQLDALSRTPRTS